MKLYNHPFAPNPRRVRIFAAEKGIDLPLVNVDLQAREQRAPEFLAKNPSGSVPVLELDDGTCLAESVAICRYLEGLHPEPNLFGRDLLEQAQIEMWNRRMEHELFAQIGQVVINTHPIFKNFFPQFPDYAEARRPMVLSRLERMNRELEGRDYVAGDRFTVADITALVALDLGNAMGNIEIDPRLENLAAWHRRVSGRPSASA
jgi:glutathione S-transferase